MDALNINKLRKLYIFAAILPIIYATLNVDELSSVTYNLDILKKPVLSGQAASLSVMYLKSRYGQEYQCTLPGIEFTNDEWRTADDSISTNADIANLLRPIEEGPCLLKIKDWWTYEFCFGKFIRQYHLEDSKVTGPEIILGHFESEFDWNNETQGENAKNHLQRYHSQYYVNGSQCEVTGEFRRTEVRFLCEEGAGNYIARVDEPESCRYVLTIHTSHVCHHPYLRPLPNNMPQSVTCNPVLAPDDYEAYVSHEEELERLAKEKRMEWLSKQEERLEQSKEEQKEADKQVEADPEVKEEEEEEEASEEETSEVVSKSVKKDDDEMITVEEFSTSDALKVVQEKIEKQLDEITAKGAADGLDEERKDAFMQLANTLNNLLKKLDQAEKDITQTSKTLDRVRQQIKGKRIYFILLYVYFLNLGKEELIETQTNEETSNQDKDKVKMRITYGSNNKRRVRLMKEKEISEDQRAGIENVIRNKLQASGLDTNGRKIQVKIIAAEYGGDDDDDVHVLTDEQTKQFQRLVVTFLAGNQEAANEMEKQRNLEENYRFVWGNSKKVKYDEDDD
uniref:Protein OS-9 n=1 Tax=Strigamia maritima TaxID=126957 RepID=T1J0C5_STRMM